jgi:hypothetical protein
VTASIHKQHEWQERFIIAAGYPAEQFVGVEYQWWFNPTNHRSMRLTRTGYEWTRRHSQWSYHEVKLSHKIGTKHLLQLERLLQEPYYIRNLTHLIVASETDAVMLQLHAGDLAQYLDNLQSNT